MIPFYIANVAGHLAAVAESFDLPAIKDLLSKFVFFANKESDFATNEQKISTMVIFGKQIKLLPNLKFFGHLCLPGNPEALSQKSIWNCF